MIAYMLTVSLTLGSAVGAEPPRLKLVSDSIRHKDGEGRITPVAISPDGMLLATGGCPYKDGWPLTGSELYLWELKTQKKVATLVGHTEAITSLAFSPDGRYLASGGWDHTVRLWDIATFKEVAVLKDLATPKEWPGMSTSLVFSPDGKTLASNVRLPVNGSPRPVGVILWDIKTRKVRTQFKSSGDYVFAIALSPDGKTLAAACGEFDKEKMKYVGGKVKLWDWATGKLRDTYTISHWPIWVLAFSPDGKTLATGNPAWSGKAEDAQYGEVKLWDLEKGRLRVSRVIFEDIRIGSLAYSPDGKMLVCGSYTLFIKMGENSWGPSGVVALLNPDTLKVELTLKDYYDAIESLAFSKDGKLLATPDGYSGVKIWEVIEKR